MHFRGSSSNNYNHHHQHHQHHQHYHNNHNHMQSRNGSNNRDFQSSSGRVRRDSDAEWEEWGRQRQQDEYKGLMTPMEKNWLKNIQQMQLESKDPYVDDFYYTVCILYFNFLSINYQNFTVTIFASFA